MDSDQLPLILNDVLQVPIYQLSKQFRTQQKNHEQGTNTALKAIKDLLQRVKAKENTGEKVDAEKVVAALDKISAKLKEVKEQAKRGSSDVQNSLESLTFRLAMRNGSTSQLDIHDSKRVRSSQQSTANEKNLELAIISNHLLRIGRFQTYKSLCREAGCEFLLNDVETFQSHAEIIQGLVSQRNAEPALAWCAENRTALKKKGSSLEFELRLRQFCDIVGRGEAKEAVLFARKYLAQNVQDEKLRKAMATLAFPATSLAESPYKFLFADERWGDLKNQFIDDRNSVLNLNSVSPLEIVIRVGLAVIKTNSCKPDGPGRSAGCPACQPSLGKLAQTIPRTIRERSALVCRISGCLMEDPVVLPNGQAYSKSALEHMAQTRGDGRVVCPVTHQEFLLRDCRRAYVL